VDIWEGSFGAEILFLDDSPVVTETVSGVLDDLLSVDVIPIVCEEDISILDEV
jgi:hypothetical protein